MELVAEPGSVSGGGGGGSAEEHLQSGCTA
jgi:hypothetical protein